MNILVFVIIAAAMIGLKFFRLNTLLWLGAWWVAIWVALRFGIDPPLPSSIVNMFMGIITIALAAYLTATSEYLENARTSTRAFLTEQRYTVPLAIVLFAVPTLVAWKVYSNMSGEPAPPVATRTIHPVPPAKLDFKGRSLDLATAHNPYRELESADPAAFATHVDNGRRVYFENCVYCHGDNMEGDGNFAHGFDPIPANFRDATTIAMLQESYLFWRIAKGAQGLPEESTPWASAMPAWEKFLTEDEIWDVIIFLYDYTGQRPRAREELH